MKPSKRMRTTLAVLPLLAATQLALQPRSARADRPLASETADVVEVGQCIVDSAARRLQVSHEPTLRRIGGTLGCGLFGGTQLLTSYVRASGAGLRAHELDIGGKTNLVEVKEGQNGYGIVYGLGFVKEGGHGLRHDTVHLSGLLSRELGHGVIVHANLGASRSRAEDKTRGLWSLGVETTGDFGVAADVFGESGSRPNLSLGMGYSFRPGWSVNLTLLRAFESPKGTEAAAGLRIVF